MAKGIELVTLRNLRNTRDLRAQMLTLAAKVAADSRCKGTLEVIDAAITEAKVRNEWAAMSVALSKDVASRISLVVRERAATLGRLQSDAFSPIPFNRINFRYEVLRNLLITGFEMDRRQTSAGLCEALGASRTPIAAALRKLLSVGGLVETFSDGMRIRPEAISTDVLAKTQAYPETLRFRFERGARIKPPEVLAKRARRLVRCDQGEVSLAWDDLRLSGTAVAVREVPSLDLLGTPRLDLVAHVSRIKPEFDPNVLRELDDGLEFEPDVLAETPVVVTVVRAPAKPTQSRTDVLLPPASPADVFLSLLDLGLRSQAMHYAKARRA